MARLRSRGSCLEEGGSLALGFSWRSDVRSLSAIALIVVVLSAAAFEEVTGQDVRRASGDSEAAPSFVHEVWTVQDGLPVNSINALLQSRDGYLWAATFDGLVRFDGVRFTVYSTGNSEGLPSNRILDLVEARDGSLWMRTEQSHLVRFQDGAFTHFDSDRGLRDNTTRVIYEDAGGAVWIGTEAGLGSIQGERFVAVEEETIGAPVSAIVRRGDGELWVGTAGAGLFQLSGGAATQAAGAAELASTTITTLYEDPSGVLWIGTSTGAFRYRRGALESFRASGWPAGVSVWEFLASGSTGAVWMLTELGAYGIRDEGIVRVGAQRQNVIRPQLIQYDAEGQVWFASGTALYRDGQLVYQLGPTTPDDPIPVTEIRAFLHDHEGSLWIGTNASGLHRLKPSLFTVYSEPEGVAYRNVYSVLEDRSGALWLGTWSRGLSRLADGAITSFTPEQGYPSFIQSLLEDRAGRLWVGAFNAGVQVCALPELSCSVPASSPIRDAHVYAMHQDVSGTIWFGTSLGLFLYRDAGWTYLGEEDGAPSAPVRVFQETRDGALWMGTNGGGLARYLDRQFVHVGTEDGIPSDLIRSLYQDEDGWLWVGTEGRGLARIDPAQWSAQRTPGAPPPAVTVYRAGDGLFDEVIHQILEDEFGRLWMSTNRGIFWVTRAELLAFADGEVTRIHPTSYTERDGLLNREANGGSQPAGTRTRDGRLWFPTQDGVAVVDPASLQRNSVPPSVVIEQVTVQGRSIRPGLAPLELDADQRDLQIDYTALSFMAPENMRFRYRLEGYNTDWVEAGNRRTAFYTNVPPGRYVFRVIASNDAGIWNEQGAAVQLSVAPHFRETKTYYALLALMLGLLAATAVWWRVRGLRARERELSALVDARTEQLRQHEAQLEAQNAQLEAQAVMLKELDRAKSHIFANVSHEFRTPLTLTIGPLEDLRSGLYGELGQEPSRQLEMALRNARRLQRLVNQVLDTAKLESGAMKLRARQSDLVRFVRDLASAFAPLAERRQIRFRFGAPSEPLSVWFDPGVLEKVFANLLSNAFKFTPEGGEIALDLNSDLGGMNEGRAVVRVTDSGPGIPEDQLAFVFERFYQADEAHVRTQPGTGIGLSLAKEYVELHGGTIQVESDQGTGTTFTVALPLGREHLRDDQIADDSPTEARALEAQDAPEVESVDAPTAAAEAVAAVEAADLALAHGEANSKPPAAALKVEYPPQRENDAEDITTVLVVDDNADVRSYIRAHLESTYRIVEAAGGADGIALATTLIPDLVISDVMMPGTDGHALCRALRGNSETDFIPVILLTARASTEHKVAGLAEGADDYVVKPFEMPELEARVANLIESRRRLRERFAGKPLQLKASIGDMPSADQKYLERVRSIIEENLSDETFGVTELADRIGQDRSHFYRRIRTLLDETPSDLIRRLRLERAAQLLAGQAGSVAEVAYAVGFKGVSYFCKCFRDAYGLTPSAYRSDPPGD